MKQPAFWQGGGVLPALLTPASCAFAYATRRRMRHPGWCAPVPVLCVGNSGVGGAGKTTVVLDLVRRLRARGMNIHCLSRGYGGRAREAVRVEPGRHGAASVGDEPLLLAQVAPTWVGRDRAVTARLAAGDGATGLIMDDGLQNPTLAKTASLLVVDGAVGFGNGRVIPAGPLREPAEDAAARCRAGVLIGPDATGARARVPTLRFLQARLVPTRRMDGLRVYAFSGTARPRKFFDSLREAGADLAGTAEFADHHPFSADELRRVLSEAARLDARPVTTAKDSVRLPAEVRSELDVFEIELRWEDAPALEALLGEVFG